MTAVMEVISKDELTVPKLMEVYKAAYINAEIDADGDIKLNLDGIKAFVRVSPSQMFFRLYAGFPTKPGTTRLQALELCNRINDGLVMLRACCPAALPTPSVWLDHYLNTEAGLSGEEIVDETRRFRTVVAAIPPYDTEHILP